MKYIVIERPNGVVTVVRSEPKSASEPPLTEHEQIINELFNKLKNLGLFSVSNNEGLDSGDGVAVCPKCQKERIKTNNGYICLDNECDPP